MPQRPKGPRLYLRTRGGRDPVWVIRDRGREVSTGCGPDNASGAERALQRDIGEKHEPPKRQGSLDKLFIADVLNVYLKERAPKVQNKDFLIYTAAPIIEWWEGRKLEDVRASTCQDYVTWRCSQNVSDQTARHDLKTMRAAIKYWHANYGPLDAVPVVTMPAKASPREDYWLSRSEVARRIKVARKHPQRRHVARMLLIGVYTGTRPGAILGLKWLPSTAGGWFDLETRTLHRRATGERGTIKMKPKARIHNRLLPHLERWKRLDAALGITAVVHYQGVSIKKLRRSWGSVAEAAGATRPDGAHICRHTAVTWLLQAGVSYHETAGFVGMSPETVERVYGHHHPDFQKNAAKAKRG